MLAALALTLAALAGIVAPAPAATARDPCAFANELLRAGILRDAATHFHAAAKRPDGRACAAAGLTAIRRIRRARAQGIRAHAVEGLDHKTVTRLVLAARTGEFDQMPHVVARAIAQGDGRAGFDIALTLANAHYLQVAGRVAAATLAAHPEASIPHTLHNLLLVARARATRQRLRKRRLRSAHQHLAAARALSHVGLDTESRSELEEALKANPAIVVPDELASPTRRESSWNSWLGRWGPRIVTAAEIVAVALAVVVGVLLLILLVIRGLGRFRARVRIARFTGDPEDCRDATAAALRENFGRLNDDGGGRRAKFVSSSGESFTAIPARLVESFPQLGWIADLVTMLSALLPTRTRRVSADLRPRDPIRGAGLTIAFGRLHGKVFDEETLWEADYGPPPDASKQSQVAYDSVALAAAAWLTFASARYTLGRSLVPGKLLARRWSSFDEFKVLGTDDWRSYALFAVGADREQSQLRDTAQQCYREALARDPANRGAMFNLVGLELQATPLTAPVRRRSLKRLKDVRVQTNRQRNLWYRVRYMEAVVNLRGPAARPRRALKAAVDLCASLLDELDRLDHPVRTGSWLKVAYRGRRRSSRSEFLHALRPAALILLANALEAAGGSDADGDALDDATLRAELCPARVRKGAAIVAQLQQAPVAVLHRNLVAYAKSFRPFLPNALYVLACYDTRVADSVTDWDRTEHELRTAIERDPSLGRAALLDDALIPYRAHPGRDARLNQLVTQLATA